MSDNASSFSRAARRVFMHPVVGLLEEYEFAWTMNRDQARVRAQILAKGLLAANMIVGARLEGGIVIQDEPTP